LFAGGVWLDSEEYLQGCLYYIEFILKSIFLRVVRDIFRVGKIIGARYSFYDKDANKK